MNMKLDVYNTHMELYPYELNDYPVIENMYTAIDKYSGNEFACGYLIDDKKLFLPRGTPVSKIQNITGCIINDNTVSDPIGEVEDDIVAYCSPRDKVQEDTLKFLISEPNHQVSINLKTGFGKTIVGCIYTSMMKCKTIVITPNDNLKMQWIDTFSKSFSYTKKHLLNINESEIMMELLEDKIPERDIYFVNHQTIQSFMRNNGGYMLHKFFKKLKIGLKIYDEAHMQFYNILMIDFYSNTDKTVYLTATFDRTDKTESICFQRAFNNVSAFGEMESIKASRKHVIYHVVNINSHASPKDKARINSYNGMSAVSAGKYQFMDDKNETAYRVVKKLIELMKDVDGKILIFVPLIEAVDKVTEYIIRDFPNKTVAAYHSKISKKDKEDAMTCDIVVSTIKSTGTGFDLKGLRGVICVENFVSKITAQQAIGRLREYAPDKDTMYFDVVDISVPPITWWFKSRFKKIQELVKQVVYLDID